MDESILKPTLRNEGFKETQTYDLSKLFYVAFFGGTIPITILGSRNAKWLGIKKNRINIFFLAGLLILVGKMVVFALNNGNVIEVSSRDLRLGVRVADVLLYLAMYFVMKPRFYRHMLDGGEASPLLKDAIKWIAIGMAVEFVLLLIGGTIGKYVFG